MHIMETSKKEAVSVLALIIIAIFAYLFLMRIDRWLLGSAVHNCESVAQTVVKVGTTQTVNYPVEDVYKKCMKDKGY